MNYFPRLAPLTPQIWGQGSQPIGTYCFTSPKTLDRAPRSSDRVYLQPAHRQADIVPTMIAGVSWECSRENANPGRAARRLSMSQFMFLLVAISLLAALPGAVDRAHAAETPAGREYYELRLYHFKDAAQQQRYEEFLRDALIPALNRAGSTPVG